MIIITNCEVTVNNYEVKHERKEENVLKEIQAAKRRLKTLEDQLDREYAYMIGEQECFDRYCQMAQED